MNRLFCWLGLHCYTVKSEFYPSIDSEIVLEFKFTNYCMHCGKVLHQTHKKWDMENQDYFDVVE